MARAVKVLKHFELPKEEGTYSRLICLTGPNKGSAYFIMENRVVLGRSEKADIRVLDIKSSREHAEIVLVGKDYVVTDLGSQNGIIVNDLKVKQHVLNQGDKIIIGQTVYKFSFVEVKGSSQKIKNEKDEEFQDPTFKDTPKKKKGNMLLTLVILAAISILFLGDDDSPSDGDKRDSAFKVNEVSGAAFSSKPREKDKNAQEKLNVYFHKGLREYREGNYFRAMSEFQHALSWSPGDALAEFYLRKTKETLDKKIEDYFINARREAQSLKYQSAIVSYCSIIRLLYNYKTDERYTQAIDGVKEMEKSLGLGENEVECFDLKEEK